MMSVRDLKKESLDAKKRQLDLNPCLTEQNKSLNCLELNAKDSDKCLRETENYKMCKTFWYEIKKFRQNNGIQPILPEPQERQQMKDIYMKTGSVKPIFENMKKDYDL